MFPNFFTAEDTVDRHAAQKCLWRMTREEIPKKQKAGKCVSCTVKKKLTFSAFGRRFKDEDYLTSVAEMSLSVHQ